MYHASQHCMVYQVYVSDVWKLWIKDVFNIYNNTRGKEKQNVPFVRKPSKTKKLLDEEKQQNSWYTTSLIPDQNEKSISILNGHAICGEDWSISLSILKNG